VPAIVELPSHLSPPFHEPAARDPSLDRHLDHGHPAIRVGAPLQLPAVGPDPPGTTSVPHHPDRVVFL